MIIAKIRLNSTQTKADLVLFSNNLPIHPSTQNPIHPTGKVVKCNKTSIIKLNQTQAQPQLNSTQTIELGTTQLNLFAFLSFVWLQSCKKIIFVRYPDFQL